MNILRKPSNTVSRKIRVMLGLLLAGSTIRRELLDHVIPLHQRHLLPLGHEYIRYYHHDRTHIGLDKQTPAVGTIEQLPVSPSTVVALPRVGGLHHRYTWSAAA